MPGLWVYMSLGFSSLHGDHMTPNNKLKRYKEKAQFDKMFFDVSKDPMLACSSVGLHETREILMMSYRARTSEDK